MIQSGHMKSCLAAQKRFLLFKGPGSFKNFFLIGGNVEDKPAYRLIPRTPPLPGHFTVPLSHKRCYYLDLTTSNGRTESQHNTPATPPADKT